MNYFVPGLILSNFRIGGHFSALQKGSFLFKNMITKESIVPQIDILDINSQKCDLYLGAKKPIITPDPYQNELPAPVRIKSDEFGDSARIKTGSLRHALCIAAELRRPGCASRAERIITQATKGLGIVKRAELAVVKETTLPTNQTVYRRNR